MGANSKDAQQTSASAPVDPAPLQEIFARHAGQKGALIPILQGAQEIYGYLPGEVLRLIAKQLSVSLSKVYGVATFYAQFYMERRGRHVLKLCDGTACHVNKSDKILGNLEEHLGIDVDETTSDGLVTLQIVACMGACSLAPVVVISDQTYGRMTPERAREAVQRLREE